jgi:hypothetical protein
MQVVVSVISDRINIAIDRDRKVPSVYSVVSNIHLRTSQGPMGWWYRSPWLGGLILDDVSKKGIDCSGRMENLKAYSSRLSWSLAGSLEMNIFLNHIGYVGMSNPRAPPKLHQYRGDFSSKGFHFQSAHEIFLCGLFGVVPIPQTIANVHSGRDRGRGLQYFHQ